MRIESAFIAGHVEVDPVTEALVVRSGFQNYVRVPSLPFSYDLGLAILVQIAFGEYDRPFTLAIDVDRVQDGWVMHHEDFTFEIPCGLRAMDDGFSHRHPLAFTLPLEFYKFPLGRSLASAGLLAIRDI